jgi:hypothetical protein
MLLFASRQCKGLRMFSLSQKRRRFTATVTARAGAANGERVRQWFHDKKVGWYRLLEDRRMPVATTVLDQAHNALDRKLFMMKGFHYPKESQKAFLNGLALLYNLVSYQRRAKQANRCGVEVEGGTFKFDKTWKKRRWLFNLGPFVMAM